MHRKTDSHMLRSGIVSIALLLPLAACGSGSSDALAQATPGGRARAEVGTRYVACTVMPLSEINPLVGGSYTALESQDDGHSSSTTCHYTSATNPAGMSVIISWINPRDYSSEAEHLALRQASLGGARLGGKLGGGMAGPGNPLPNGAVEGVGDEATTSMLLLTARKGDHTVTVQIIPTDMMAVMTDSTFATAILEKEKTVARKVFEKI